ncbi:inter-alpha-trypsin inhibitor heavy chain H5 [Paramormyrops kingsleyae]|uniref:inter-alpha-trypsin inhibitor heavy chain H5 n=1 Tax=Paramormyrops kingsleyae TaxID=1676925 RepID=UPI003B976D7F
MSRSVLHRSGPMFPVKICPAPIYSCEHTDGKMIICGLLLSFSLLVWGNYEDVYLEDGIPSDLEPGLDFVPRRDPRQVKVLVSKETKPHMQEFSVKTTIISRYAFTAVSCTLFNRHAAASEGIFQMRIPADAYISNFTMVIGGQVYPSEVRPKQKKVRKPKEGESRGRKGEREEKSEVGVEVFRAAASIPGKTSAVFLLTYEHLLQRRLGRYEHVSSLRPLQLVSRLSLDVIIVERAPITSLEVLPLRNGKAGLARTQTTAKPTLPVSTVIKKEKNVCRITFTPSIVQQAKIATNGILGDFIIRYDVERELGIGDVQVLNGHFVHYFAPEDLPVVPKNVVFVIDTSASMIGTKIRQTKEALFTILKDLRPNDHFNFISFSNRIKVWKPGQLVPVTPENIRDAKKFIYSIMPTGGTDINGALEMGSSLFSSYLSNEGVRDNGVSLIIFLTDGRPTVGELQHPRILSNAKAAAQEKFCVFTIGLGKDVDQRLLERLALDNCGITRQIPEEVDASAMFKGFYDEIGTPLLSDIRVAYSKDAVEYVTQHLFPNYFNGSEIVIAGKLTNQSAESLHVQVQANSGDKSVVLESDVPIQESEKEMERRLAAADAGLPVGGYTERLWGFLSVKDALRSRLRSQSSRERDELGRQAANLSLAYNFLTPLTSMAVETPQVLFHNTLPDSAAATSSGLLEAVDAERSQRQDRKPGPEGKLIQRPAKKSITISKTSADGDPHFVVEFPLSKLTVCFNINGERGDILRLVSDHTRSGVTVNGKLIGAPAPSGGHKQQRTYFSTITVVVDRPRRGYIEITPRKVILDSRDRLVLPCHTTVTVESDGLVVAIVSRSNVTVTVQGTISFVILIHQYKNPAPYQRDHLGFYISNSKGLSKDSHGLLGQFLYQEVGLIVETLMQPALPANGTSGALLYGSSSALKIKDRTVAVVKKTRKIYNGRHKVDCWFVRNNAAKLIDGRYQDYVVPHLFETAESPHGHNTV